MNGLTRLWRFLFDFSAAQQNREEVETILQAALLLSRTDRDFLPVLRGVLKEWEGGPETGRSRYYNFLRFMHQHRRGSDESAAWRSRAQYLIEDLPRIYGSNRSPATAPTPHSLSSSRPRGQQR